MLNTLQYNMSIPTAYVFMKRFLKAAQADKKVSTHISFKYFNGYWSSIKVIVTDFFTFHDGTAWAGSFFLGRAISCGIWDAEVSTILGGCSCSLHSSMHCQWLQTVEQDLWMAHKLLRRSAIVSIVVHLFSNYPLVWQVCILSAQWKVPPVGKKKTRWLL